MIGFLANKITSGPGIGKTELDLHLTPELPGLHNIQIDSVQLVGDGSIHVKVRSTLLMLSKKKASPKISYKVLLTVMKLIKLTGDRLNESVYKNIGQVRRPCNSLLYKM
jgi:hypothetical protein